MEEEKDIVAIGESQLSSLGEVDLQASPQPAPENCLFKVVDINTKIPGQFFVILHSD